MKNAILAGVFFVLVGIAYLVNENVDLFQSKKDLGPVISRALHELKGIELPNTKLVKENDQWIVSSISHPVDEASLKKFFEKLEGLRIQKVIKSDPEKSKEFFTHQNDSFTLVFHNERLELRLGDVSSITGHFYLGKKVNGGEKIYIVKDISFFEGLYKTELEAELRRYLELKTYIEAQPFQYADTTLFNSKLVTESKTIIIDNLHNRPFTLNLSDNSTDPKPPKGISPSLNKKFLLEHFKKVRFKRFVEKDNDTLEKEISKVEFGNDNGNTVYKIFGALNGRQGLYAIGSAMPNRIYILETEGRDVLFSNTQSFWNKIPNLGVSDLSTVKRIDFELGAKKTKLEKFVINDVTTFEVKPLNKKVKLSEKNYFNLIFNALFAGNGFEQAEMVTELTKKQVSKWFKGKDKRVFVNLFNKNFAFKLNGEKLLLLDLNDNVEFVYPVGNALDSLSISHFFAFK